MSVLLVGIKLSAGKELVQVMERRKELKANLSLLRRRLEDVDLFDWLNDVDHDSKQRKDRVAALLLESQSGCMYTTTENEAIDRGEALFAQFDGSSGGETQVGHSATILRSETKLDKATGLLLGRAEAIIRASPHEIVAYLINYDGRHVQSDQNPAVDVRVETLQHVNAHHTIIFNRKKAAGLSDRTFLNSLVAKVIEDDPSTYLWVAVPAPSHAKIGPKDEAKAVRAEVFKCFRLTEVGVARTKLDYVCHLDLRGLIPQIITNQIAVPQLMHGAHLPCLIHSVKAMHVAIGACSFAVPLTIQRYFQQIWRLADCDAKDGEVVGQMLIYLLESKPEDPAHAIREFAYRTDMLRECAFCHIGEMLEALLTADAQEGPVVTTIPVLGPSSVTEEQAAAIGSAIASSVHQSDVPATALKNFIKSHSLLRGMKSEYLWFVPMLEVLTANRAGKPRRSTFMHRLSTIGVADSNVPQLAVDAARKEDDGSFGSVVPFSA